MSCKPGVLNREFLGIVGRELSASSSQLKVRDEHIYGKRPTQHKMPHGIIVHQWPRHASHAENFYATDRECPNVVGSCQLAFS
jgi:hypothetical protein